MEDSTHNPSPSSFGSKHTSKVIHPSGFSMDRIRTSCRSKFPVPARTAMVDGVYESSRGKLRYIEIFYATSGVSNHQSDRRAEQGRRT